MCSSKRIIFFIFRFLFSLWPTDWNRSASDDVRKFCSKTTKVASALHQSNDQTHTHIYWRGEHGFFAKRTNSRPHRIQPTNSTKQKNSPWTEKAGWFLSRIILSFLYIRACVFYSIFRNIKWNANSHTFCCCLLSASIVCLSRHREVFVVFCALIVQFNGPDENEMWRWLTIVHWYKYTIFISHCFSMRRFCQMRQKPEIRNEFNIGWARPKWKIRRERKNWNKQTQKLMIRQLFSFRFPKLSKTTTLSRVVDKSQTHDEKHTYTPHENYIFRNANDANWSTDRWSKYLFFISNMCTNRMSKKTHFAFSFCFISITNMRNEYNRFSRALDADKHPTNNKPFRNGFCSMSSICVCTRRMSNIVRSFFFRSLCLQHSNWIECYLQIQQMATSKLREETIEYIGLQVLALVCVCEQEKSNRKLERLKRSISKNTRLDSTAIEAIEY